VTRIEKGRVGRRAGVRDHPGADPRKARNRPVRRKVFCAAHRRDAQARLRIGIGGRQNRSARLAAITGGGLQKTAKPALVQCRFSGLFS
jgi:hypothetical protein